MGFKTECWGSRRRAYIQKKQLFKTNKTGNPEIQARIAKNSQNNNFCECFVHWTLFQKGLIFQVQITTKNMKTCLDASESSNEAENMTKMTFSAKQSFKTLTSRVDQQKLLTSYGGVPFAGNFFKDTYILIVIKLEPD